MTITLTPTIARRIYERWRPLFRYSYQYLPGETLFMSEFKLGLGWKKHRLIIFKWDKP